MAKLSRVIRCERNKQKFFEALQAGRAPHFPTRVYNRCRLCGRVGGFFRRFQMCRICLREHANEGLIMGLKKSSW